MKAKYRLCVAVVFLSFAATPPVFASESVSDYEAISRLVTWERQSRVRHLYDEMANCYFPDATVTTSWTKGPASAYLNNRNRLPEASEGYIRNIGLTEIDAETLRRAYKIHPIHTVELEYSLVGREIEKDLIPTAKELGVRVLTFGSLGHGLLNDRTLEGKASGAMTSPMLSSENLPKNLPLVRELKDFAVRKGVSLSQLMTAWTLSKLPDSSLLIGTTSPEHLQENIDSLTVDLSPEDMREIENIAASHKVYGNEMRRLIFQNGIAIYK